MKKIIFNFKSKDTKKIKYPKNILGGKGANLAEMGRLGFPVPPGFTISTEVCEIFYKNKWRLKEDGKNRPGELISGFYVNNQLRVMKSEE